MKKIMKAGIGDKVVVVYDGFLADGEVFESSEASGPLEFKIGVGEVLPAFEEAVINMEVGETKNFTIKAAQAHGPVKPELIHRMERSTLPDHQNLHPGMVLGMKIEHEGNKHEIPALLTALDEEFVTLDFNHPLAGKDLKYKLTLREIKSAAASG